jgi:hypothetical protein
VFQLGHRALGAGHLFRDIRLGHTGGGTGADECIDDDRALDAAIKFPPSRASDTTILVSAKCPTLEPLLN